MIRRLAPVAVAALAGTLLSAPPAASVVPFEPPTLNVADGDTISQLQLVTMTDLDTEVSSVRVSLGELPEELLPVEAGAASVTLETWGLAGPVQLTVTQCDDADGLACDAPIQISLNVDNPEPTYTPSRPGTLRTHDFDVTVGLDVASGTPQLSVGVDDGPTTLVAPGHLLAVDVDALAEGPHEVRAAVCSADGTRCTSPSSDAFDVVRTVAAGFALDPAVFSPNDDGRSDEIGFTYGLDDPWEDGVIEIRDSGLLLRRSLAVTAPAPPETQGTIVYDGSDELGIKLASGDYTATFTARRTVDGETISSSYPLPFAVDLDVLPVTDLALTTAILYPQPDGYLDTLQVSWTAAADHARVDLVVQNASGQTVRFGPDVQSGVVWDGRDNADALVVPGDYSILVRARDAAGNQAWSAPIPLKVSDKIVATRTRSVTVRPKASLDSARVGSCSRWKTPSVHGWPGSASYLSNVKCPGGYLKSRVWTIHTVELPAAVRYRKVRLGWFGGPTKAGSHHTAIATLYKEDGVSAYGWYASLDYLTGQHLPWTPAGEILQDGVVEWALAVSGGNRYDVKSFTIRYRADVLVNPG